MMSFKDGYFEWLLNKTGLNYGYVRLASILFSVPFRYSIPKDSNRASDGISLRIRYMIDSNQYPDGKNDIFYNTYPCSILEMMLALAIHCEEDIMDDPLYGDRTEQWFWEMIVSLGLNEMTDLNFDKDYCEYVLERFLNREYSEDGNGSLFFIPGIDKDMRLAEIWYQMQWYVNSIT